MNEHLAHQHGPLKTLTYDADLCGNIEQALKGLQGYGIMALEIIQNADDAGARNLTFDVRSQALIVRNDASFSSCGLTELKCPWEKGGDPSGIPRPCNFHALSRLGSRSKVQATDQIGRFGIGFVAVYQITDTPIVRSVGTEIQLNPQTGQVLQQRTEVTEGTEIELRYASQKSEIREALNASPTPPDVEDGLAREIAEVLRPSLFFLRNLERVEVLNNGRLQFVVRVVRTENGIVLEFGPDIRSEEWLILSRDADDMIEELELEERFPALAKLHRSKRVSVAIRVDGEEGNGLLYAYLPTQHKSGMPIHINGDFFPHASRQDIVLKGEGHERYWNEALLDTAAELLGANFELLRDKLGHTRLWQIIASAFQIQKQLALERFWDVLSREAKAHPSVWTTGSAWQLPAEVVFPPEQMPPEEQVAVASIGIKLLDPTLRRYWSALSSLGVNELRLSHVVPPLERKSSSVISTSNPNLHHLWAAVQRLLESGVSRPGMAQHVGRLQAAEFLLDTTGTRASPNTIYRVPPGVEGEKVRRYLPDCRLVHPSVLKFPAIVELIDEYSIDQFASDLSDAMDAEEDPKKLIGERPTDARAFYELLLSFPNPEASDVGETLQRSPILLTPNGFVTPERGKLPGEFRDPTGYFELVDTSLFPPGMDRFAQQVLNVDVLTFHEYIDDHIDEILAGLPTKAQYQDLLRQMLNRRHELEEAGTLALLSRRSFVRTRAGTYCQPNSCYFWTAELEALLGDEPEKWIDETWLPVQAVSLFRDLLESKLGTSGTVTPGDIVGRFTEIAEIGTPAGVSKLVTPIFRYLLENWRKFRDDDFELLATIRELKLIPAIVDGRPDEHRLYLPSDVFRVNRSLGFSSQVPIIDLLPLRQSSHYVNELLDLLEVPSEPETQVVVDHLKHCMESGIEPSPLTYLLLNERVENDDDAYAVDDLMETKCIYIQELGEFVDAGHVFWQRPPFRGYWWAASSRMRKLEALLNRLGLHETPSTKDYATLIQEIAAKADITEQDLNIHLECLGYLGESLDHGETNAQFVVDELREHPCLLTVEGKAIWPEEGLWVDSEQLSQAFGSSLNDRLVKQPAVARATASRLFRILGVKPISEVARFQLAEEPDRIDDRGATEKIQDRSDLILWLAPNGPSYRKLRDVVQTVRVQLTHSLKRRAEILGFDPPIRAKPTRAAAFYEVETGTLHVEGRGMGQNAWTAAFGAIFREIEAHCPSEDIRALVTAATLVMVSENREEAEEGLREAGYRPPSGLNIEFAQGEALGDGEYPDEAIEGAPEAPPAEDADRDDETCSQPKSDLAEETSEARPLGTEVGPQRQQGAQVGAGSSTPSVARFGEHKEAGDTGEAGYRSKAGSGLVGKEEPSGVAQAGGHAAKGQLVPDSDRPVPDGALESRPAPRSDRKSRTSRMLAYVARSGDRAEQDPASSAAGADISEEIDNAAMEAALNYETKRVWTPVEQPHNNPGYDIISTGPNGDRRLIEVKGLEGEWTERGVKLTHVQYGMAEDHPEEFWIYVVEFARDLNRQKVSAIANPFQKVDEYWFDQNWRSTCEEVASSRDLNVSVGGFVKHTVWGKGAITAVERRGIALYITVDFGFNGKKYIPFNSTLEIVT